MIAQLRGEVSHIDGTFIVLDVGGVGYKIAVRQTIDFTVGDSALLHTYLAVRENALDLYGFNLRADLVMFEMLIRLPKIGPKSALQIMTQADTALLKKTIREGDARELTKMSGIGKKTAEKIVSELQDLIQEGQDDITSPISHEDGDVIEVLISLGYAERDARDALKKIPKEATTTNERIKFALKYMGI